MASIIYKFIALFFIVFFVPAECSKSPTEEIRQSMVLHKETFQIWYAKLCIGPVVNCAPSSSSSRDLSLFTTVNHSSESPLGLSLVCERYSVVQYPPVVEKCELGGCLVGDQLISVNGNPIFAFSRQMLAFTLVQKRPLVLEFRRYPAEHLKGMSELQFGQAFPLFVRAAASDLIRMVFDETALAAIEDNRD